MKKILTITVIAILVAALSVSAVMAEDEPPTNPPGMPRGNDRANNQALAEYMDEAIAEVLGISLGEYETFMQSGATLYDIAEDLGIDLETLPTLRAEAREIALQAAEADGIIFKARQRTKLGDGSGNYGGNGQGQGNSGSGLRGRRNANGMCYLNGSLGLEGAGPGGRRPADCPMFSNPTPEE